MSSSSLDSLDTLSVIDMVPKTRSSDDTSARTEKAREGCSLGSEGVLLQFSQVDHRHGVAKPAGT